MKNYIILLLCCAFALGGCGNKKEKTLLQVDVPFGIIAQYTFKTPKVDASLHVQISNTAGGPMMGIVVVGIDPMSSDPYFYKQVLVPQGTAIADIPITFHPNIRIIIAGIWGDGMAADHICVYSDPNGGNPKFGYDEGYSSYVTVMPNGLNN